jgi:hypothetical protein
MSYQTGPSPAYTPEQLAEFLSNVNVGVGKEVHELKRVNFVDMADYKRYLANCKHYKKRNQPIPLGMESPWDHQVIPVGAWRWNRGYHIGDTSVARLEQHSSLAPYIHTIGLPVNNDFNVYREATAKRFEPLIAAGTILPDLEAYGYEGEIYIIEGHRRLHVAKQLEANVRIWVEPIGSDARSITRSEFLRQAIGSSAVILPAVVSEFEAPGSFGIEVPEQRIIMSYREKRRAEYSSFGDQLDALHKQRQGDSTAIQAVDAKILAIKAKYPSGS